MTRNRPLPTRSATGAGVLVTLLAAGVPAQEAHRPPSSASDPAADSLVSRWIESAGGMEVYHGLRDARFTLTTELYNPETGRLRRARPRYVTIARLPGAEAARVERWEGDDFIVQGFDGETAWARRNGEPIGPGDMDFDQVPYIAADVNYWIALPFKLRDPGVRLRDAGTDDEGRRIVEVTFDAGVGLHQDVWRYFFADGHSWPVEVQYIEEGTETLDRTRWVGIRTVDGYPYVSRRVHLDGEGRITKIIRTSDVELNPGVDPAVFRQP